MSSTSFELENEIVRAGAGAGKTTRLTQRVIEVAEQFYTANDHWPNIVITTFTRKATQELRERLIVEACKSTNSELVDYVSSPSKLLISTIHGVLGRFLRRYGHLLDIDPSYTVIADQEASLLGRKVLKGIIIGHSDSEPLLDMYSFNELYHMAVGYYRISMEHPDLKPITEDYLKDLYKIQLNQMERELRPLIDEISPRIDPKAEAWLECIQSISKLLDEWKYQSDGPRSGSDYVDVFTGLPRIAGKAIAEIKEELKELKDVIKNSVLTLLNSEAAQFENWTTFLNLANVFESIGKEFSQEFLEKKLSMGKFEMSDLELVALDSIRREPDIAKAFSADWDYWLVDEYQDTSPIQVEILDQLIGHRKSFVVGDPQQSIYLFRGARSEVFSQKEDDFIKKSGIKSLLQRNWRSDPELLLFFNDFFSQVGSQFFPMEPKYSENLDPGRVVAKIAIAEECTEPDLHKTDYEDRAIVSHIFELIDKGCRLEDVCVLARTNKVLMEVSSVLDSFGIPTHVHSASGFYDRREVLDALAFLKFLVNPHDNINLVLILRSPWLRITDEKLAQIFSKIEESVSHWEHLLNEGEGLPEVTFLKEYLASSEVLGLSGALKAALINLGFIDVSMKHDPTGRRESNIWKLIHLLRDEERRPGFNAINFINRSFKVLDDSKGNEESDAVAALEPNRVNLMTVHASKGLQFKHLLVPRMSKGSNGARGASEFCFGEDDGRWSLGIKIEETLKASLHGILAQKKLSERESLESERLLYVALTRAKESIFLSWAGKPARKSWAEFWMDETGDGLVTREFYSYVVDRGPWDVKPRQISHERSIKVRDQFELSDGKNGNWKKIPVTGFLKNTGGDFKKDSAGNLKEGPLDSMNRVIDSRDNEHIQKGLEKAAQGSVIHEALEILKYDQNFDFANNYVMAEGTTMESVEQAVQFVRSTQELPLMAIIENGEVEWGFQYLTQKGILEGQIDLWGRADYNGESCVWIVDYKSGSPKYVNEAFDQLRLYSIALEEYGEQGPIKMVVLYPLLEKFEVRDFEGSKEAKKLLAI